MAFLTDDFPLSFQPFQQRRYRIHIGDVGQGLGGFKADQFVVIVQAAMKIGVADESREMFSARIAIARTV